MQKLVAMQSCEYNRLDYSDHLTMYMYIKHKMCIL